MRWEDERYVRLYTRDTATWMLLPWQGRCLLPLLLRKLDRAGVIEVLAGEEAAALEQMLGVPREVVEVGLAALLGRGVFVLDGGRLLMPHYLEAQECSQSDKVRKQISREKAAKPQAPSQLVTDGHSPSQLVTPSRAVPCLAVPVKKPVAKKPATPADVRLMPLTIRLASVFEIERGAKYHHGGAKDAVALKALLPVADDDEILSRWRKGLRATGWASCSTIAQLGSKWNDLAAPTATGKGPIDAASQTHTQTGWLTDDGIQPLEGAS